MKKFGGKVCFLDRSDINTDEIIPAKYLTEVEKDALKPHLLEDLELDGFDPAGRELTEAAVVVTRANFGCGSSREHAPWAFEVNGIYVAVAESFARIFRQNMFNCGMLAIELPPDGIERIFELKNGAPTCGVDLDTKKLTFSADDGRTLTIDFTLSGFDEALVRAGGWVEYADKNY